MKKSILALSYGFLALAGFVGSASEVRAQDNDLCVCQTGSYPTNQVAFFRLGCRMWNAGNSCGKKLIVPETESLNRILSQNPGTRSLKVGFVGHWSSAAQSVDFLRRSVVPAMRNNDVSVEIDNTACLATDNPYIISNYLRSLGPIGARIKFRGNQAISTGLWDRTLPGKHNFWALISGDTLEVDFPKCSEFENRGCLGMVQREGRGICHDEASGDHVTLRCQLHRSTFVVPASNDNPEQTMEQTQYLWKRSENSSRQDPRLPLQQSANRYSANNY